MDPNNPTGPGRASGRRSLSAGGRAAPSEGAQPAGPPASSPMVQRAPVAAPQIIEPVRAVATPIPRAADMPLDPRTVLNEQALKKPPMDRRKLIAAGLGALVFAHFVFPDDYKPGAIVGGVAQTFYAPIVKLNQKKKRCEALSEQLAQISAREGQTMGNCTLANAVGFGGVCSSWLGGKYAQERSVVQSEYDRVCE